MGTPPGGLYKNGDSSRRYSPHFFSGIMNIKVKRIYDKPSKEDGLRVLVDRLWPRGVSKKHALIDVWLRDIAPSNQLRKWFDHDPEKWEEFKSRYFSELDTKSETVNEVLNRVKKGTLTLVFSAKQEKYNNAEALKVYLGKLM
jgi:uncharacterized protein YeaO (DUF488 family)